MSLAEVPAPIRYADDLADRTRIEYFRAYQAVLDSPQWAINLLWGMLAVLSGSVIPFLGMIVWTGYLYECVEQWHVTRGRQTADFDANRFADYLTRGIWPFLVQLVIWFITWVVGMTVYFGTIFMIVVAAAAGEEYAPIVLAVGFPLLALTLAVVVLLPLILLSPLMLRAGLSQDLTVAFKLAWWRDFLKRVGLELVLTTLFVIVTGALLMSLGCVVLLVGSYAAWAWVNLASAHLTWQLYELYLARGGEPIPLKPRVRMPLRYGPPGHLPPASVGPADSSPSPQP